MSTSRLTTISFVILGLIGLRGPSTSYDLERATSNSIGYFWPFPRAQLYSEPKKLVDAGLLAVSVEEGGRRRHTYSLTDNGKHRLSEWLADPLTEPMQVRDVAELKLFFAELTTPENIKAMAQEQVEQHSERLKIYRAKEERYANIPALELRMVPLELGIRIEQTVKDFWEELAKENEPHTR
ncbi:PadR family transcriptional regulator [Flaviflexus massiliensis]|uniref:PadR family transcriptional regulator n=1 Tax=Flaviflexus massiliensis TaxID=1522309 RepID=UPI0006D5447C|nr:PadR family transcriptional regulator [Flaviflexus massiliensis]